MLREVNQRAVADFGAARAIGYDTRAKGDARMKTAFCAAAFGALMLAGCAPTGGPVASAPAEPSRAELSPHGALNERIAYYARLHDVPESLIHRSIRRESGYNPAARNGPYWGLMQIRYDTAQGMGYRGSPSGLLDADTNLAYGVPYLANAYHVGGRNESRAISLYAGGYYYEAKRKGMLSELQKARAE
jgi:soluble lytic murein transglycosylase-like protein